MVKKLKIIFFLLVFLCLILVFYVLLKNTSQPASFVSNLLAKPLVNPSAQTVTLGFITENSASQIGEIWKVKIAAETNLTILGADLEINFNPKVLELTEVTPGEKFSSPVIIKKQIDQNQGHLFYALGTLEQNSSPSAILAHLQFKLKTALSPSSLLEFGKLTDLAVKEKEPIKLDFNFPSRYAIVK